MAQETVICKSCDTPRVPHHMLRIECLIPEHQGGHRDCLDRNGDFYICRPALSGKTARGHRPDCLSRTVMGADVHRIVAVSQ